MKLLLPLVSLLAGHACAQDGSQSQANFAAALVDQSTSPFYVRIQLASPDSAKAQTTCVEAPFLLGAIMREYGLADPAEARQFALSNTSRRFEFSRPEALANLSVGFNDEDLARMRRRLAPYSTDELTQGFQSAATLADTVLAAGSIADQDAAACVLIERGLSPRRGDRSGRLYVTRCRPAPVTTGSSVPSRQPPPECEN